ncbi:iron chelate uptake ABC transporter family permease subunit [Neobacillus sedimentimangrovi]|jgi:iron complex transport system permease protein|uniref:Iron chelate uptake ABC transporter family permease subunit n=1 Tax=Neobacillus sedimentimangrovi TaxID=2699460 RepID=A0ABS8QFU1_9BACI|nr:iron chelate uptake ABC transporter family permease subunit [Neobacillus sedimentimangrovi]MCD4837449.1 iron chelate uptake ABC transporter family permease subunit [Neobacillus sedimentimangrovi]
MRNLLKITILVLIAAGCCALYLFHDLNGSFDYALPRRVVKVVVMVITGFTIAYATVVFQTITHNRILTPSIMGLDALYLLLQTIIIFFLGSDHTIVMNKQLNFLISLVAMIVFALLLYRFLFKKGRQQIYFLLLVGIIVGTFFSSISKFFQVLIDPNEFQIVQDRMFASFNNINPDLVWLSLVIVGGAIIYAWRYITYLDVLSLGREVAINLGVPYDSIVRQMLIIVAIFISISTALVGPITFFGLIVANLSYQFFKTYKHRTLITGAIVLSIIALVGGQWVVERIFTFSTTLSVIINFVGGVYFIYLLLKERKAT